MELEELKTAIVDAVNRHWDEKNKALLLSQLGSLQDDEIARSVRSLGHSLTTFIPEHLDDKLIVLKHSLKPTISGVIPTGKIDASDRVSLDKALTYGSEGSFHKIQKGVWWAFRHAIDPGFQRIISFENDRYQGSNLEENLPLPEHTYVVDTKWLAKSDDERTDDEVYAAVAGWAKENGINLKDLAYENTKKSQTSFKPSGKESILDLMLNALSEQDMKRITMPLDVVHTLHKTRR